MYKVVKVPSDAAKENAVMLNQLYPSTGLKAVLMATK